MLIKNANIYRNQTNTFEMGDVRVSDGIITDVGFLKENNNEQVFDAQGKPLVAGLIDVHTHGRAGYDFVNIPADKLTLVLKSYAEHGVTSVMPTIASAPLEEMKAAVSRINEHSTGFGEANICGVHLEGRYLNVKRRGAHAESLISPPCADELEDEVFRMCRALHITAAFELDESGDFARKALEIGATLGIGHTEATYEQSVRAEQMGVTSYTHLFNVMPSLHHRQGGPICAALMGKSYAELICDGIHISVPVISFAFSALTSKRTVLISDSMEATGKADGEYSIAGNPVKVSDGIARTLDGALAGSTLTLDAAVRNLMQFCNIPLEAAIPCATENPAREIGVFDEVGSIDIGKRADMLILSDTNSFDIEKIMINGRFISK